MACHSITQLNYTEQPLAGDNCVMKHCYSNCARGLEYIDKQGGKHQAIERWTFTAADGVEMPLEEGTSAFITMNPGYIGRAGKHCLEA
jgi:hypothetical protein